MSSKDIAIKLAEMLNDKKAEDIVVIDIAEKSSFADFLVVASGTSDRHIESLILRQRESKAKTVRAGF